MQVYIEVRERKYGKLNIPCKSKIALTETRQTVVQLVSDAYFAKKITGVIYRETLKLIDTLTKRGRADLISELLTDLKITE